jgi:hypothetical protein
MGAPSVSEDPSGEFGGFSRWLSEENDRKSPRLVLSDEQHRREAVLAYGIAVEHIRVAAPPDSRTTARYCEMVRANSAALAGGDARLHLRLLHGQLKWLRSLPAGCGELR